jgi:hypothetical protein
MPQLSERSSKWRLNRRSGIQNGTNRVVKTQEGAGQLAKAIPEDQKAVEMSQNDKDAAAELAHAYAASGSSTVRSNRSASHLFGYIIRSIT